MSALVAGLFIAMLVCVLLLHVFGLPANWILAGLVGIWRLFHPEAEWGLLFLGGLVVLAIVGEVAEFLFQAWSTKRYGGTSKGMWAAIIGAIAGSILGAPFLLGVGALVGAVFGAFAGCFIMERLSGLPTPEALDAAMGAMWGKVLGMVVKVGLGVIMLSLSVPRIWPG